ncbi:uncharacterized protein LOC143217212 isoform X1 [Lasioglossum baleicum]|uniref:uncharacterized protein LOC143217212 isoform X1 n=1 Tax=Lasioglossum baleicum TaxID=434251 RepID=UPI003FCCE9EF
MAFWCFITDVLGSTRPGLGNNLTCFCKNASNIFFFECLLYCQVNFISSTSHIKLNVRQTIYCRYNVAWTVVSYEHTGDTSLAVNCWHGSPVGGLTSTSAWLGS